MKKIKVAIIFGGMSTEHEVSIVSATSVIKNINKERYEITAIYIDKKGEWYQYYFEKENKIYEVGEKIQYIKKIENEIKLLKQFDVVFPVLHGFYGEDGTIQGLLELLKVPYVGCGVLSSSIGMDKVYTKIILEKAKINQAKYIYIRKENHEYRYINENFEEQKISLEDISKLIEQKLKYPMFIKPANSGSSVGINKAKNKKELIKSIEYAAEFDKKVLIEQGIEGKEVECAVLGNADIEASVIGEIISAEEFYSFDAKYKNEKSLTRIPANIEKEKQQEIKKLAIKAFRAIDGKGLARVDFFVEKESGKIYLNEINTLPGFTKISMYPQLWEKEGISYSNLLDKLITLALEK